jgi:glutathione S-transferase
MKLYFFLGACSLAPHIVAREAGLDVQLVRVDTKVNRTETGEDYLKVNAKGYVPVLELDDGARLTEAAVIVQYLADRRPELGLMPAWGTMERYRAQEWLNYIATELHKGFGGAFFKAVGSEEDRQKARDQIFGRFDWLNGQLLGKDYLMGSQFTAADAYLFVVVNWARFVKVELDRWPAIKAFHARVKARPAVQAAIKAESPTKAA